MPSLRVAAEVEVMAEVEATAVGGPRPRSIRDLKRNPAFRNHA
jgi:hypothetical protein